MENKLVDNLLKLSLSSYIGKIILGYEPAEDEDMKICEMIKGKILVFNDNRRLDDK